MNCSAWKRAINVCFCDLQPDAEADTTHVLAGMIKHAFTEFLWQKTGFLYFSVNLNGRANSISFSLNSGISRLPIMPATRRHSAFTAADPGMGVSSGFIGPVK